MTKALVPKKGTGAPGPAMAALNERQQHFVRAMLQMGGQNHMRCARAAGYTGDDNTMAVTAHRLAHDERILAALKEEADKRIKSGAILGASVLLEIAGDSTHKDRYRAAVELLNRAGLQVITEHKVTVHNSADERASIERITAMAMQLGLDPKKLVGEFVDAEFSEVAPRAALPAPMGSTEGLEDIL